MKQIKNVINVLLAYLCAFLLVVMTGLVLWQVFTRYVIGDPSMFTEELVRFVLIWTSFLGAAYAFGTRQHMSLVFLKEGLNGKSKRTLCAFLDLLTLVITIVILIKGGFRIALGSMSILTPVLGIPKGLVYMVGPISGIIIAIYQLINIWEDFNTADESTL